MASEKLPSRHAPLPNRVTVDKRLSGTAMRLLALYAYHDRMSLTRGKGDGCTAANHTLCSRMDCDYTTLIKLRKELEACGYLQLEPREGGKRLEVARVIPDHLADPESWPFDQSYIGPRALEMWGARALKTGEVANNRAAKVGQSDNFSPEKVGEDNFETRGNPPKTGPQYIPLRGETYFSEESGTYSPEGAQLADREPRNSGHEDRNAEMEKTSAQAVLGNGRYVSIEALLPDSFWDIPSHAQLASFERALDKVGRQVDAIEPTERKRLDGLLVAIADAYSGTATGERAQRLYLEMEGLDRPSE